MKLIVSLCYEGTCCYVCESNLGHRSTRQRDGQSPTDSVCILEMAVGSVRKDVGGQTHHAFMVCHARVWIETSTVQYRGAMYEHLRVVPPGKRLRVPSCTRPEILGSG